MSNILLVSNPEEELKALAAKFKERYPACNVAYELNARSKEFTVSVSAEHDGETFDASRKYWLEQLGAPGFIAKEIKEMATGIISRIERKKRK